MLRLGRWEPLVWIAPAILVVLLVFAYSMVQLAQKTLEYGGKWAGLANLRAVVEDPTFRSAVAHNGRLLIAVPTLVLLALLLAVLLFEGLRGWRFHRWAVFFPYVLPIPVVGVIFGQLLQLNGLVNQALRAVGLGTVALDWLGQPRWALWSLTGVIVWKELGFGVMLFLARLFSLPSETFEAARIDGARFFRLHRYITVPQLASVIAFYVVVEAITMVSAVFNYVFVISNGTGGPGDATQVAELYIYQTAFQFDAPEIAAAAATILFGVTLILIVLFFRIQRRAGLGGGELD